MGTSRLAMTSHNPCLMLLWSMKWRVIFCLLIWARVWDCNLELSMVPLVSQQFRTLFGSLCRHLARGARAVLQLYAENMDQSEMIMTYAMRAGFVGGVVVDWPTVHQPCKHLFQSAR